MKMLIKELEDKVNGNENEVSRHDLKEFIAKAKGCNSVIGASTKLLTFFVNDMLCLA